MTTATTSAVRKPTLRRVGSMSVGAVALTAAIPVFAVANAHSLAFLVLGLSGVALALEIRRLEHGWTFTSLFVMTSGVYFGFANAFRLGAGEPDPGSIDALLDRSRISIALFLSVLAVVVPALAAMVPPTRAAPGLVLRLPSRPAGLLRAGAAFALATWACRLLGISASFLGFVSTFVADGVVIAIFMFRVTSALENSSPQMRRLATCAAAVLLIIEIPYQLSTSLLRSDSLWVFVAWFAPPLFVNPQRMRKMMIPVAAVLLTAVTVFGPLGEQRHVVRGTARLGFVLDAISSARALEVGDGASEMIRRSSNITQLTLIERLRSEGHSGPPIDPIGLIVPRFLWPSKSTVSVGEWFAEVLDRGSSTSDGFSNAINLTPVGHFWISYGLVGALVGLAAQVALFRLLWTSSFGRRGVLRAADVAVGFVALKQALFLGSAGTVLVSQLSLLLVAASLAAVRQTSRSGGTRAR